MATATKTKRARVEAKPIINNTGELDDALADLCDITSTVNIRTAQLNQDITALREQCDTELSEDLAMKARLEKDIEEYCTYYRDTIFPSGKKSLELVHGEVNFRQHPPAVVVSKKQRMTIAGAIDKIREFFGDKASEYLRVKPELNKEALVTLDQATLESVGLEIQQKETFGFSLKLEALAPVSSSTTRQTA